MAKLTDLKGLLAQAQKDKNPSPPTPAAHRANVHSASVSKDPPEAVEEIDLRRMFADVAPLPTVNRARVVRARPSPVAVQRMRDEANALVESKHGDKPSPASWDVGQELESQQTFLRRGLGVDVLSKLRRGRWVAQGELDLHRLTVDEARDALARFLVAARSRGWRCVRVIHGKGLSSPNREPVLKGKVRRWLERWDAVLAYCEAPRHSGGSGAVLVLLKSASA